MYLKLKHIYIYIILNAMLFVTEQNQILLEPIISVITDKMWAQTE
jgi:hypothetical protein